MNNYIAKKKKGSPGRNGQILRKVQYFNNPITSTEIEVVSKILPKNKSPGPDGFIGEFCQTFRKELMPILLNSFKKLQRKKHLQNHSMGSPSA